MYRTEDIVRIGFHALQVVDESLTLPNTYRDDLLVLFFQSVLLCSCSQDPVLFFANALILTLLLLLLSAYLRCIPLTSLLFLEFF